MSTSVSLKRVAARNRFNQSMELASAIQARRLQLLKMTIEQAAEFSGLKPNIWAELEAGFIPPMDNTLWIWWTLAGTLQVSVSKLFNLASVDLARDEMLAKKKGRLNPFGGVLTEPFRAPPLCLSRGVFCIIATYRARRYHGWRADEVRRRRQSYFARSGAHQPLAAQLSVRPDRWGNTHAAYLLQITTFTGQRIAAEPWRAHQQWWAIEEEQ